MLIEEWRMNILINHLARLTGSWKMKEDSLYSPKSLVKHQLCEQGMHTGNLDPYCVFFSFYKLTREKKKKKIVWFHRAFWICHQRWQLKNEPIKTYESCSNVLFLYIFNDIKFLENDGRFSRLHHFFKFLNRRQTGSRNANKRQHDLNNWQSK